MAGSNNIPKYALWNKEDEFLEFKHRGIEWSQVGGPVILTNTLTVAQMKQPFSFGVGTPTAITGPTSADLLQNLFGQGYLSTVGSTAQTVIQNTSNVPITVTFPGLGAVVIPANSYYTLGLVVTAPGVLGFYSPIVPAPLTSPAGVALAQNTPVAVNGVIVPTYFTTENDIFVWNGSQWVGSSTINPPLLPTVNDFKIHNHLAISNPAGTNLQTNGRVISGGFTTFGTPGYTTQQQYLVFGYGEGNLANLQNPLGSIIQTGSGNFNAPGPVSSWRFRAYSHVVPIGITGQGFNHNPALAPLFQSEAFYVDGAGNLGAQVVSSTSLVTVSSRTFKKDIEPAIKLLQDDVMGIIDELKPVSYRYKTEEADAQKRLGLIVEDIADSGFHFLLQPGQDGEPAKFKADQLPFLLLQAVKALREEVKYLEREISKNQ